MRMAWPQHEKAKPQHYETGLDVEPSGQEKEGEAKNLATWPWGRHHATGAELAATGEDRPGQETGVNLCKAYYAPGGAKGLST